MSSAIVHNLVRSVVLVAVACLLFVGEVRADGTEVQSTDPVVIDQVSDELVRVGLPLNKARVVRLPVDARDVIASNTEVADIVLKTPRMAYLIGNSIGTTNIIFLDAGGQQIARLNVTVAVERGQTVVRAMNPEAAMGLLDNPEVTAVASEVGQALKRVLAAVE